MRVRSRPIVPVLLVLLALSPAVAAQALVVNVDVEPAGAVNYVGQGAHADPGNDFWNSSFLNMCSKPQARYDYVAEI